MFLEVRGPPPGMSSRYSSSSLPPTRSTAGAATSTSENGKHLRHARRASWRWISSAPASPCPSPSERLRATTGCWSARGTRAEGEAAPVLAPRRDPRFTLPSFGRRGAEVEPERHLQGLYRRARFDLQVDYARPPVPPLSEADAAWAAEMIAAWRGGEGRG